MSRSVTACKLSSLASSRATATASDPGSKMTLPLFSGMFHTHALNLEPPRLRRENKSFKPRPQHSTAASSFPNTLLSRGWAHRQPGKAMAQIGVACQIIPASHDRCTHKSLSRCFYNNFKPCGIISEAYAALCLNFGNIELCHSTDADLGDLSVRTQHMKPAAAAGSLGF